VYAWRWHYKVLFKGSIERPLLFECTIERPFQSVCLEELLALNLEVLHL
jgi:hypothetical protein